MPTHDITNTTSDNTSLAQPFLKWAGGKRQLLADLIDNLPPKGFHGYFEPFVGGGALLFELQPSSAVINDFNAELMNAFHVIKDDVEALIVDLKKHENTSEYFYHIRKKDREPSFQTASNLERASRLIYLNKTCYNGLYRVNSKNQFNVPFGKYKNPAIVNEAVLRAVSSYLNECDVSILNVDFEKAVEHAGEGDLVYFDPPYDPLTTTSSFTSYSMDGFNRTDQERLRDTFMELHRRGCYVLLSNSNTEFINDLYSHPDIFIKTIYANRNINSKASGRGKISEVLIKNYGDKNKK